MMKFFFVLCFLATGALAAEPHRETGRTWVDNFQSGRYEGTLGGGVLFAPAFATRNRPTVNEARALAQIGYMWTEPRPFLSGKSNLEFVGELLGSSLFEGRGNYIAGTTFWLRYNWIPPHTRFVPFAQIGAGTVLTDVDRRIVGQGFNFTLATAIGSRFFLTSQISLNLEYRFEHISNANQSRHNVGLNAQGPLLTLSYLF